MRVEGLLPADLCLVTLASSEQCSQFDNFRLQYVQIVKRCKLQILAITSMLVKLAATLFDV